MSNWEDDQTQRRNKVKNRLLNIGIISFFAAFISGFVLSCIEVYIFATGGYWEEGEMRAAIVAFCAYIIVFVILVAWIIIRRKWHRHDVSRMSPEERERDHAFNEEDIVNRLTESS